MYNVNINLKSDTISGPKVSYSFDIGEDWKPVLRDVLKSYKTTAERFNSVCNKFGKPDYYLVNVESTDKKIESDIVSYVQKISTGSKRPNRNWNT